MAYFSGYVGAKSCTSGPQTGVKGFMSWFLAKYKGIGGQNSGIYNCRTVRGSTRTTSLHGEGRAADAGLKWVRKEFQELADLLRTHSKELGIQCIIYDRKIWSGISKSNGWSKYTGVNPHTDHLHIEFSWSAARLSEADYVELIEKTLGGKVGGGEVKPTTSKPKPTSKPNADVWEWKKLSTAEVKSIQRVVTAAGKYKGKIDGRYQELTRKAVKGFQHDANQYGGAGLKADGYWGAETQAYYDWVRGTLQPAVAKWNASQRLGRLVIDGHYGPVLNRHVKAIQTANYKAYKRIGGLYQDGQAGKITCALLGIKPFKK